MLFFILEGLSNSRGEITVSVIDIDGNTADIQTPALVQRKNDGKHFSFWGHYTDENPELFQGPDAIYEFRDKSYYSSLRHYMDRSYYSDHRGFEGLSKDFINAIDSGRLLESGEFFVNEVIAKARIGAIITGRGHESGNLENIAYLLYQMCLDDSQKKIFIENVRENFKLGDMISDEDVKHYYFQEVLSYYGCANPQLIKMLFLEGGTPEKKVEAMSNYFQFLKRFISKLCTRHGKPIDEIAISLGFSDDSIQNIVQMYRYLHSVLLDDSFGLSMKASVFYSGEATDDKLKQICTQLTKLPDFEGFKQDTFPVQFRVISEEK